MCHHSPGQAVHEGGVVLKQIVVVGIVGEVIKVVLAEVGWTRLCAVLCGV